MGDSEVDSEASVIPMLNLCLSSLGLSGKRSHTTWRTRTDT